MLTVKEYTCCKLVELDLIALSYYVFSDTFLEPGWNHKDKHHISFEKILFPMTRYQPKLISKNTFKP